MNLYEMTGATAQLYEMLNNDEIDEQTVNDTLEGMGIADKLEGYCQVIRQLEADSAAYESEKRRFEAKQKSTDKAVNRLLGTVLTYMQVSGKEKEKVGVFEIKVSKSEAVNITDMNKVLEKYLVSKTTVSPDKKLIKEAIKSGQVVEGAEIQSDFNLKIK